MRQIIVFTNLTLDGVMQAPGRPDEDRRGGFEHGGWATPYAAMQSPAVGDSLANFGALLLGRRTYEDFYGFWPHQTGNPFNEMLTNMQKYVASTTLHEPLPWANSMLLKGDLADAVSEIKAQDGPDMMVMGSGVLIQSLMQHECVDRYVLLIHPLVLGAGRRLFPDSGSWASLKLETATTTDSGVIVATFTPKTAS